MLLFIIHRGDKIFTVNMVCLVFLHVCLYLVVNTFMGDSDSIIGTISGHTWNRLYADDSKPKHQG